MATLHFRTLFLSDLHLGTRESHSDELIDYLAHTSCDRLYLLGDIFDLWKARSGWHWPSSSHSALRTVLDMARCGTQVTYIPGNHDEALRDYFEASFEGVVIQPEAEHVTADGRRILLLHGDEFDNAVRHNHLLQRLGTGAYDLLLALNRWQGLLRRRCGLPHWSLAGFVKSRAGRALEYIERFEEAAAHAAAQRGYDGIVCGHIHRAALKDISGITYYNCGDWVESCTAIAEDHAGNLQLICWPLQRNRMLEATLLPRHRVAA